MSKIPFSPVKWQYSKDSSGMFHKQIATFSVEVHQNSFKKLILRSHAISDFEDLSFSFFDAMSCSVGGGRRALKSPEVVLRFYGTRQIELNDEYLCKYSSNRKFLWV